MPFSSRKPAVGSRSGPHWGQRFWYCCRWWAAPILLTRQSLRTKLAAKPQSGVAVRMPKTENQLTLLVCTAGEQPRASCCSTSTPARTASGWRRCLPETAIPFGQGEATLAQCYAAAGPARCREALLEPLALPETTRYLALSPSVLAAIADRYRDAAGGLFRRAHRRRAGPVRPFRRGTGSLGPGGAEPLFRVGQRRHPPAQPPGCRPGGGVGRVFPARSRTAPHDPPCGPPGPQLGAADRPDGAGLIDTGKHAGVSGQRQCRRFRRRAARRVEPHPPLFTG